jgi:hypothetical protein
MTPGLPKGKKIIGGQRKEARHGSAGRASLERG